MQRTFAPLRVPEGEAAGIRSVVAGMNHRILPGTWPSQSKYLSEHMCGAVCQMIEFAIRAPVSLWCTAGELAPARVLNPAPCPPPRWIREKRRQQRSEICSAWRRCQARVEVAQRVEAVGAGGDGGDDDGVTGSGGDLRPGTGPAILGNKETVPFSVASTVWSMFYLTRDASEPTAPVLKKINDFLKSIPSKIKLNYDDWD